MQASDMTDHSDSKVGVFDSGFGGLTIHRALIAALPERDFVYLGDNRNAPYGAKKPLEVLNLTCAGLDRLFAAGCTLVVVACNTASTVTLRWIQQQWLPARQREDGVKRNAIGIVVPTIEVATGLRWHEEGRPAHKNTQEPASVIAVFATARTVETGSYPLEIHKRRPDFRVVQQACPELASAVEAGAPRADIRKLISGYWAALQKQLDRKPDSVILGCTHYPLVADIFAEVLPQGIPIIDQPAATAEALKDYLARHPEYRIGSRGTRSFLSTGYAADALPQIEKFWGGKLDFRQA
jgi:glutamate racemase